MDSEEVIKIDLSQKVSTPQQQKKEISHKVSLIKLEISSPADANAYYTIDKGDKPVQGQTTISKSGDSGCYVKTINAEEYRNSSLMVRCYAFNQIHTELTLKIAPPQLLVKSALFKKDGATVGDNCLDIVSDTNFVITVELTRPILDGENAKLHYKRYHKEPGGNVFKEYKTDTVDLKKNDRFKDITFYAPENHSGGTMAVSFYINQEVVPNENKSQNTVRYYKIVSKEGTKISSVYWSQNEAFTPIRRNGEIVNYENSQVRNQICNNEDGFLHIHTRQMYGEKVKVSVFERDRIGDDAFIISRDVMILDNRACVVFSMQELLPMLYSSRNAWFEGSNFDLVAIAEPVNRWIPKKEGTAPLYLKIEKRTYTPAKSTIGGTRKFVAGTAGESKQDSKVTDAKKCPRCDQDITVDEIKKICVNEKGKSMIADESQLAMAIKTFNDLRKEFKFDTCLRKVHFISQICEETHFHKLEEDLNYSEERLLAVFPKKFDTDAKKAYAAKFGSNAKNSVSDKVSIGNYLYRNVNGNSNVIDAKLGDAN